MEFWFFVGVLGFLSAVVWPKVRLEFEEVLLKFRIILVF